MTLAVGMALSGVALSSVSAATAAKPTLDSATRKQLEQALDDAMKQVDAPGAIVGVRVGNQTWKATRGVSDTTTQAPVAQNGYTRVGSVTKTFTGTLIMQLVDEGKLSLDDTIDKWFPDVPLADQITVRMLGDMSSGINSYTADDALTSKYFADPEGAWTPEELIDAGVASPRKFAPGDGFFYSNTNFVMLGMIVEQLRNQPYNQVLQQRILDPLKLHATSFPDAATMPTPSWHGYTDQLTTSDGQPVDATTWSPTFAAMAGQMQSNLADVMTWAKAVGTGATLTKKGQAERLKGNPASKRPPREEYLFALGRDNGWLAHDGDIPGFNAQLAYLPKGDVTIVVMTNSDIATGGATPAPVIWKALATVVTPDNIP
ncbi:MAG TPA: serine hydrolase domain-containing protein [Acidimicrobiia bacterium]|jgi:D-alanyl-D-alanine carboxypeptidase